MNAAEWSAATPYTVSFSPLGTATVRFLHNGTNVYVGVVMSDPSAGLTPSFDVFFDNDHDGVKELGDDAWLAFPTFGQDFFWNPAGPGGASHYNDAVDGGTTETTGAGTTDGTGAMFELSHPLCTADTTHDICASLLATLGINFQYSNGSGFVNAPGADSTDPSTNWAHLTFAADTTAPSVSVTSPAEFVSTSAGP